MDEAILRTFKEAGLNEKEAQVYTALLELGEGDITEIAKKADLRRSNCYVLLEKLEQRGYVSLVPGNQVKRYTPADPARILHNFESSVSNFRDMLPIIKALFNQPGHKPRVQYFEGEKAVTSVYREANRFLEAYIITSFERFKHHMPDEAAYWINGIQRETVRYRGKYLLTQTNADKKFADSISGSKHEIRWLPHEKGLSLDFTIYANKVAVTSFEKPIFLVLIESDEFANSMRTLFNIIWSSAKKYRKK